jgi:dihydrofolate reductase
MDSIDTIIMGSKAYEDVILTNIDTYEDKKIIVATSRELEKRKNVEFINEDICRKVLELKDNEGRNIWLFDGAIFICFMPRCNTPP